MITIYLLNPPPLIPSLNMFWLNLSLTLQYKPWLNSPNKKPPNRINSFTKKLKNRLFSNWRISEYHNMPRFSKKKLTSFHQKQLNKRSLFYQLPPPFNNALIRQVSSTYFSEILKQPNHIFKKQFKWNLMISNLINWIKPIISTQKY